MNANAFGMSAGPDLSYDHEESFEALVFGDQLYLGMEADDTLGARIWRTKSGINAPDSQVDWEEVAADNNGYPFGLPNPAQNDHIDSLAEFQGYLYASTANHGSATTGTRVFRRRTGDPGSWQDALSSTGPGFGDPANENFKDMRVFQGHLCGGTWNKILGAQVWCTSDGSTWQQKNISGFGSQDSNPSNRTIWSSFEYQGGLYFGVQNTGMNPRDKGDDTARLYRTYSIDGMPTWAEVYRGTAGSNRVDILGALNGRLYIATKGEGGVEILSSPDGNPGTWVQINISGMDGDPGNLGCSADGAIIFEGQLYVAIINDTAGFELWHTAGQTQADGSRVDWTKIGENGLGDPNNIHARLIPFNGHMYAWTSNYVTGQQVLRHNYPNAKYTVVLIADGAGTNHFQATRKYASSTPVYQTWDTYWMSTFPIDGSYDPIQAWSDFTYLTLGATDSAAAATAMFSGNKTSNGRINVSADGSKRLAIITEKARGLGMAVGAVTSVQISHATPGAWFAHNDSRQNGFALADEGLWGNPNTTGTAGIDPAYGGGHGPTMPPVDVIIGGGHPGWDASLYVNQDMRDKLAAESKPASGFVERIDGSPDGGARLLAAAAHPQIIRLTGLFGGHQGNLEYRLADGAGHNLENPTLAEMTQAALIVLSRDQDGFALMIEGGAVDWAAQDNRMDRMIGEILDFNHAAQAVIDWVEDPANGSTWENTLVIVTSDHEAGYLTAAPGIFPHQPLGTVNPGTLALEKTIAGSSLRASWEDTDADNTIDPGETVHWAWNTAGHTNSLVPLFVKGVGANLFASYISGYDPVRGPFLDNTSVFTVMDTLTLNLSENGDYFLYLPMTPR